MNQALLALAARINPTLNILSNCGGKSNFFAAPVTDINTRGARKPLRTRTCGGAGPALWAVAGGGGETAGVKQKRRSSTPGEDRPNLAKKKEHGPSGETEVLQNVPRLKRS